MTQELKPYSLYKPSTLPWVQEIPEHWDIQRAGNLFFQTRLPTSEHDEIVTCFRNGQVTLRKNRRATGFMVALLETGYQGVRPGQLVIHSMDAFAGAIGVSDSEGKCTPEYIVCNHDKDSCTPYYYEHLIRELARLDYIRIICPAVRERAPRIRYNGFKTLFLPVPSLEEQVQIARFLKAKTTQIAKFIKAKRKKVDLLVEMRTSLTQDAVRLAKSYEQIRHVARKTERPVRRDRDENYIAIGLYNRGRGIFHKPPANSSELGDSSFFWVNEGDLVFSGQFAWEGAVALAGPEDSECIASHRYHVVNGRSEVVLNSYLYAYFQTKEGNFLLNHHSRGAAGRNRPLNISSLMKEKIPVPPFSLQLTIEDFIRREKEMKISIAKEIDLIREYRTRLISDVVTGKLDVRGIEVEDVGMSEILDDLDEVEDDALLDEAEGAMDE